MKVTALKTPLVNGGMELLPILDAVVTDMKEGSVLAVTSKIVSICESSTVNKEAIDKQKLVEKEADSILVGHRPYGKNLTIRDGIIIPDSGIDESNGDGYYVLWPRKPWESAELIRQYLSKRFNLAQVGVVITDSKTTPLRWGTTGVGIACAGFLPLKDYMGASDLYGREMEVTKANYLDGIAAAAVLVMGEGAEQTPLAIVEEIAFVDFVDRKLSQIEINEVSISMEEDIFAPLFANNDWKSGKIKE